MLILNADCEKIVLTEFSRDHKKIEERQFLVFRRKKKIIITCKDFLTAFGTWPPPLEQAKAFTHKSPTALSMSSSQSFGSADWSSSFTDCLFMIIFCGIWKQMILLKFSGKVLECLGKLLNFQKMNRRGRCAIFSTFLESHGEHFRMGFTQGYL